MPIRTTPYEFSSEASAYQDLELEILLGRRNSVKRWLILPRGSDEDAYVSFVVSLMLTQADGSRLGGGAVVALSERRLVGVITEGQGSTGPISEAEGRIEGFAVELQQIATVSAERTWRRKVKSLSLAGTADDPFAIVVADVIGSIEFSGESRSAAAEALLHALEARGVTVTE